MGSRQFASTLNRACIGCLAAGLLWLGAGRATAFDAVVITVRYVLDDEPGDIHAGSTPGMLMRYDVAEGEVTRKRQLYEAADVTYACLSPFGDRVAFTTRDALIKVADLDGGNVRVVGHHHGGETPDSVQSSGLQWPASEGGRWLYYSPTHESDTLRRVDIESGADEWVMQFNRSADGGFALSLDATPTTGHYIKRTDNFVVVVYDLSAGDGDLFNVPRWMPGCGISIAPDGAEFITNDGWHVNATRVDLHGNAGRTFRLNQWDGDPLRGVTDRGAVEWAWQHFRWSVNAMEWIAVTQGRLVGQSTHAIQFSDAVLYNDTAGRQLNVTRNPDGVFDRAMGVWVEGGGNERFLGYERGKAPLTVTLADPRLGDADWEWDWGDGTRTRGSTGTHTYAEAGLYRVRASAEGQTFEAQVTVTERRPPRAELQLIDALRLRVRFSEPVDIDPEAFTFTTTDGTSMLADWSVAPSGRHALLHLESSPDADIAFQMGGVTDRAQEPNALDTAPLSLAVPAWPSDRTGAVYLWDRMGEPNLVYVAEHEHVRERHAIPRGNSGFDVHGRMLLEGGRIETGFFAQRGAGRDAAPIVRADAFSLELTFESADLAQRVKDGTELSGTSYTSGPDLRLPPRLLGISSWYDAGWTLMLGQEDDRLLFSVRTADAFMTMEGVPNPGGGGHGRAPVIELATLDDEGPHHLVVTYEADTLRAYLDGEQVLESDRFSGKLDNWWYGELSFGNPHNSMRLPWRGAIEGVALYARVLDADEVARNHAAMRERLEARARLPRARLRIRLLERSRIPDPARIAPYREALVVNAYCLEAVEERSAHWPEDHPLDTGMTIHVAQWGVLDGRATGLDGLSIGHAEAVTLERFEGHPANIDELVMEDTLEFDPDAAAGLLYDPTRWR